MSNGLNGSPEIRIERTPNFCSLGPRPIIMTGFMRTLMRDHFANPDSIEHPQFRDRVWSPDECDSGIHIEDATVWTPTQTGKRPAIIVRRNNWKAVKMGINNYIGLTDEGFDQHAKFMQGSHTLFCIASEGAEAEILATETYRYLLHFGPVVRHYFRLHLFELIEVGSLNELEEATERYMVPITVAYAWEEMWTLKLHSPLLKRIQLSNLVPQC